MNDSFTLDRPRSRGLDCLASFPMNVRRPFIEFLQVSTIMDLYSRCMLCVIVHLLKVRNGHIKRITDGDIQSLVLELIGTNVRFVNIIPKLYTTVRL